MKIFIKAGLILLTGFFLLLIGNFSLIQYGFEQLKGQLHIILNAQPVAEVLNDPETSIAWKEKIILIKRIKEYAVDSLGLKPTENYSTLFNQRNQPVLWVLTACQPFKLEAKTWWFPLLGKVSYKGFFDKTNGKQEQEKLIHYGYDTDLSPTGGWSTLGWFKDPILSNMLKRSEGTLAELIIHEMTHGTIYLKSNVDFNENLATFIGEQGAIRFLSAFYGDSSAELNNYLHYKTDENIFGNYLIRSQKKLDSLFNSFNKSICEADKIKIKKSTILLIIDGIDSLPLNHKEKYLFKPDNDSLPNNTFFMSNNRYRKDQEKLDRIFITRFKKNLKNFISFMKETNPHENSEILRE